MRFKFLLILVFFFTEIICNCQGVATIRNVDFSLVESKLIITYDIADFKTSDKFNIIPEILKYSGEKIKAISFTGDLKEVTGGSGKKITWDIGKDTIILDEDIYVVITGEMINEHKPVSRTACFFESLIFPGWGTSRLTLKKGNLVKGFLGYGALIGSLILSNTANNSYDSYKSASTPADRDIYFNKANNNNTISISLAGCAIAIWSIDLISVLAGKNKTISQSSAGISINFGYSLAAENAHLLTCKINF